MFFPVLRNSQINRHGFTAEGNTHTLQCRLKVAAGSLVHLQAFAEAFLFIRRVWHGIASGGVISVGLHVGFARFLELACLLELRAFIFVGFRHPRPLLGPKRGVFASQIGEHGFNIVPLGAPEDVALTGAFSNRCLDFIEVLYTSHSFLL